MSVVKQGQETNQSEQAATQPTGSTETGSIAVTSTPDGADVYADEAFIGNCPATLKLGPGKHSIRVSMNGYKDWSRDVTVQGGSSVNLTASLEKQ